MVVVGVGRCVTTAAANTTKYKTMKITYTRGPATALMIAHFLALFDAVCASAYCP
ncbi:Uncharacterised protein [Mycobacterium tuberculosis]|nr:Uncharacterised protein [Mycobacterium tuberculosis]